MSRIVAVIPARAGSKGIPNKNIRFIAGKPLISYAIDNALASSFITDVIVTTDSEEVAIIAALKNVNVHWRNKALCGDAVTLDAVIYDAVKDLEADFVVTMQPTSPTLKHSTLDEAINYAIEHDLDTLISASNQPHLAWTKTQNGNITPTYKERLNRQYLPPYYIEAGAFVISKREIISTSTRIGKKVEIFEISPDEAIDIDSFDDLNTAENILKSHKIAFLVGGNESRFCFNSIVRVLELADAFNTKVDIFYNKKLISQKNFNNTTHNLIDFTDLHELFNKIYVGEYSIFINDIGDTTQDYMQILRKYLPMAKIVNLDDNGLGAKDADLAFNSLPTGNSTGNIINEAECFIPDKKFLYYSPITIKQKVKNVFFSFGGIDAQNYSDRILKIISNDTYKDLQFHVVLGREKYNKEKLKKSYSNYSNINIYCDVANMPAIMTQCDIGITSCGRTCYELSLLGIPCIALAQNDLEERNIFVCAQNGFHRLHMNPSDITIKNILDLYIDMPASERQYQQNLLLNNNMRNGCQRIVKKIYSIL